MDLTIPEDRLETINEIDEADEEKEIEEHKESEMEHRSRIQPLQTNTNINRIVPFEQKEEKHPTASHQNHTNEEKIPERSSNTGLHSITILSLFNHREEVSPEAEEKNYDYGYNNYSPT